MMKRRHFLSIGAAVVPALAVAQPKGAKLVIHITYAGPATWDKKHTMGCAIWKDTSFTRSGARTLAHTLVDPVTKTATFEDVTASTVYVTCALDTTGNWDGMSDPPQESFVGAYGEPGAPIAVKLTPGKTTTISMTWGKAKQKMPKA